MREWIHAVAANVRVGFQIIRGLESRPRIPTLPIAVLQIMDKRIDTRTAHVLVALKIPAAVE
jgi:hypothetical protein